MLDIISLVDSSLNSSIKICLKRIHSSWRVSLLTLAVKCTCQNAYLCITICVHILCLSPKSFLRIKDGRERTNYTDISETVLKVNNQIIYVFLSDLFLERLLEAIGNRYPKL